MARVIMAMSGGVDSSVSAYLMKQQGHEVIGLFMKNWQDLDEEGPCPAEKDYQDVARVCDRLEIPYYTVNFTQEYRDRVFADFLTEYEAGFTPNPDILCNREIKFKVLWDKAQSLGGELLATGHYCQIETVEQEPRLTRGLDSNKDQTYFLYTLKKELLNHLRFPIGDLLKSQVRALAKEMGLNTHDKKDSTGICFIGKRNFREFLAQYVAIQSGAIIDFDTGKRVGTHQGIAFYTIGQRKGLNIGGAGQAWFVVSKRRSSNELFVVQGEDHPALVAPALTATDISWIGSPPTAWPFRCSAKIRYRQADEDCELSMIDDKLLVKFDRPQRSITPRQSIVFYQKQICLGGAMIETSVGGLILPLI